MSGAPGKHFAWAGADAERAARLLGNGHPQSTGKHLDRSCYRNNGAGSKMKMPSEIGKYMEILKNPWVSSVGLCPSVDPFGCASSSWEGIGDSMWKIPNTQEPGKIHRFGKGMQFLNTLLRFTKGQKCEKIHKELTRNQQCLSWQ